MEIKTLEHYAVARIQELENEVERQKRTIQTQSDAFDAVVDKLECVLTFVGKLLSIKKAYGSSSTENDYYIDFKNVWLKYDRDDYEKLREMFDLAEPHELEEEE